MDCYCSIAASPDEQIALSYGLDQPIPSSLNKIDIDAVFEKFYHGLLKNKSNIPERIY